MEVTIGASRVVGPAEFPVLQDPIRRAATRIAPDGSALRLITTDPSDAHPGAGAAPAVSQGGRDPTNTRRSRASASTRYQPCTRASVGPATHRSPTTPPVARIPRSRRDRPPGDRTPTEWERVIPPHHRTPTLDGRCRVEDVGERLVDRDGGLYRGLTRDVARTGRGEQPERADDQERGDERHQRSHARPSPTELTELGLDVGEQADRRRGAGSETGAMERLQREHIDRVRRQHLLLQLRRRHPLHPRTTLGDVRVAHGNDASLVRVLDASRNAVPSGKETSPTDQPDPIGIGELPAVPGGVFDDPAPHRHGTDGADREARAERRRQAFEARHRIQTAPTPEVRELAAEMRTAPGAVRLHRLPVVGLNRRCQVDAVAVPPDAPRAPPDDGLDRDRRGRAPGGRQGGHRLPLGPSRGLLHRHRRLLWLGRHGLLDRYVLRDRHGHGFDLDRPLRLADVHEPTSAIGKRARFAP